MGTMPLDTKLVSPGIFSLPETYEQSLFIKSVSDKLQRSGFCVRICRKTSQKMLDHNVDPCLPLIEEDFSSTDFIVSIGGDGTVLKAAHFSAPRSLPILALNNGRLGFLADISRTDVDSIIEELHNGKYKIEERSALMSESDPQAAPPSFALNEICVHKQGHASLLTIRTFIDGQFLSSFLSDGLLVATPTGSTAYSLSVGGPILSPNSSVFVINPMAPHTLTVRSMVVPDCSTIKLEISGRNLDFVVSHDSYHISSKKELEITVKRAGFSIKFIKFDKFNFYSTLREKLMWGADIRN
jgi:NAD+ kinase